MKRPRSTPAASRSSTSSLKPAADFYNHTCESMHELDDDSVTLTLTSPPYWSLVDFTKFHAGEGGRDAAWTNTYDGQYKTYSEYLAAMTRVFAEVYRVTKPGGFLALQVASMTRNGRCYPIGCDLIARLVDLGWRYEEFIYWHKGRNTSPRAGVAIQHPYPGYVYPGIMGEYLYILSKPGPKLYKQAGATPSPRARLPVSPLFVRDVLKSVWHIPPVYHGDAEHPTIFPEELVARVIALWSYPGDLVLDPFLGSGQTMKVARAMGRRSVGYELEPRYIELARRRLDEPLNLRRRQLVPRYDHVEDDEFLRVGLIDEQSLAEPRAEGDPDPHEDGPDRSP